jgi:hypothetical protein
MCAMMQKFLIRAGAVNVLSAKLLMGISWWGGAQTCVDPFSERYQRIDQPS